MSKSNLGEPWYFRWLSYLLYTALIACLIGFLAAVSFGQDVIPVPADYREPSAEVIAIGHQLFFDERMSPPGVNISCATCHDARAAYSDPRHTNVSQGIRNLVGNRNAPMCLDSSVQFGQFHDGVAALLEDQCTRPLLNQLEMGNQNLNDVVQRLRRVPGYRAQFQAAFGGDVTIERIGVALAAFQRQLVSSESPYDRYLDGDVTALTTHQKYGAELFNYFKCSECHQGHTLRDGKFHSTGLITYFHIPNERGRGAITSPNNRNNPDEGKHKTASLRNVRFTWPYGTHGQFPSLNGQGAYLEYLNRGGIRDDGGFDPRIDPRIIGLRGLLGAEEKSALADLMLNGMTSQFPIFTKPPLPQ